MKFIADYLDRKQCDSVKGFFILLVFISHFLQYVVKAGGIPINLFLGQLMVAPFMFYSGFGVMESIKKKGIAYIHRMPKNRILITLVNFDIAVLFFLILNMFLGNFFSFKKVILSFVAWESIGNSNWYIFVIILCYSMVFLVAIFIKSKISIWTLVGCSMCMFALLQVRPSWWYSTILCFPVGMIYSEFREIIERIVRRFYWSILCLLLIVVLVLMYRCPSLYGIGWNIKAVSFSLLIVVFTMKFSIRLFVFEWCGRNLFPLYIYQRIPMIALFSIYPDGFIGVWMPAYFIACFFMTILIARFYSKWHINF